MVASIRSDGKHAHYSSPSSNNWISAPGGDVSQDPFLPGIFSTDLVGCSKGYALSTSEGDFDHDGIDGLSNPNCSYVFYGQGTSYAAPVISGAIALLRGVNKKMSWRDLKYVLAKTAVKVDAALGDQNHPDGHNLANHTFEKGWIKNAADFNFHNWYGFGKIDVTEAMKLAKNKNFDLKLWKTTEYAAGESFYNSGNLNLSIPDNSNTGTSSIINVLNHDLTIEHVQIKINVTHDWPSDLGIELTSPSGTVSKLMTINSNIVDIDLVDATFGSNAFYGERSLGAWTIKVVDGATEDMGKIVDWSIIIHGNTSGNRMEYIKPIRVPLITSLTSNILNFTPSPSTDILRYEVCTKLKNPPKHPSYPAGVKTTCLPGDWYTLKDNRISMFSLEGIQLPIEVASGYKLSIKIKAIDTSENESPIKDYIYLVP